jgi:hypothetical protein
MKSLASLFATLVIALAGLTGCHQNVKLNDLAGPVRATIEKEAAGGGEIGQIQKRQVNGKPAYLAEVKDKSGKWWDVKVAEDGKVLQKD